MTYQIGICDDEVLQVKINSLYIKDIAERNKLSVSTVGFTSPTQLFDYLATHDLHIVFMDIDMGGPSGISAGVELFHKFPQIVVIFITGHNEFASSAYDVEALGYILKPVDIKKLERLFKKAIIQIDRTNEVASPATIPNLVITEGGAKIKIPLSDIIYIERIRYQSVIFSTTGTYHVYESITSLEEKVGYTMLRINQSQLVNPEVIHTIKGQTVYLKNGQEHSISRSYRKTVLESFLK